MHVIPKYLASKEIKLIRDPIYNFIEVPKEFLPIIDNKLFQRLRWVSQLPLEQLVYPSAQHSRFEHSLGTMYLSMLVAITLLNDDISKKRIYTAIQEDPNLNELPSKGKARQTFFVIAAGIVGLLHDVGHAPFSHTLEEATNYTRKKIEYNHEKIGYMISKQLVKEYTNKSTTDEKIRDAVATTVLSVLNKDNKLKDLTPLQKILRTIIDSDLDVDKGDYVLRDSYHCGVKYGYYGQERLWRHVRITEDYALGVSPKGAVEAWSLKLARYKMYKNVYKHHVRNITDALLIRILSQAFDVLEDSELRSILPLDNSSDIDEETLLRFSFWTDNLFLKTLLEMEDHRKSGADALHAKQWIERFMKRELPKRFHSIRLERFGLVKLEKRHYIEIKKAIQSIDNELVFIILKEVLPPVFTKDVQAGIRVVVDKQTEIPLAEYLGFSLDTLLSEYKEINVNNELDKYNEPSYFLDIFAFPNTDKQLKSKIEDKLSEVLK